MENVIRSFREVIERLAFLDRALDKKHLSEKLSFFILGGSAFLLLFNDRYNRVTHDIDIYLLNRVEGLDITILNDYDINNELQGVATLLPDYEKRMKRIKVSFRNIEAFVPDPIDLIITKLARGLPKDINDIIESGILDDVDRDKLKELYDDLSHDFIGHTLRIYSFELLLEEFEAFKKNNEMNEKL